MVRAVRLHEFGGPANLSLDEVPRQDPGPGEVRLRVQAAGLTRDQLPFLRGQEHSGAPLATPPTLPTRFGYEVAGVVEAVGEGVDASWIGRRVAPIGPWDEERYGCVGDESLAPADALVEYPDTLSAAEAAALWVPFLTAYGVIHAGGVQPGDYVSLPAGGSAIALAAMQIVRDRGAYPIAVVRHADKADRLRELGAHDVIVTDTEDYVTRVGEITGGVGVRVTYDPVNGPFLADAAAAASVRGVIVVYGMLAGEPGVLPPQDLIGKGLTVTSYTMFDIVGGEQREEAIRYILDRAADGRFTPRVARTFGLDDVRAAFDYIAAGPDLGRTVIQVGPA
ncbi:zinc-dependent alcohol dehydrogenase family protein [Microbacterium gorillae]|uniref:zinc-dependent alcohol dehydrogenase family protein n=1 Tax=Microbacterium gorillae TaxID=1231063 RepID=UPI00058DBD69|nr:zinc-dependent alcohol dehydrogenase family protein [Microbacterium gorillae]